MAVVKKRSAALRAIPTLLLAAGLGLACSASEATRPDGRLRLSVRPDSLLAGVNGEIVISIDVLRDGRRVTTLSPTARSTNLAVATVTPVPIAIPDAEGAPVVIVRTHALGDALIIASVRDGTTELADTTVLHVRY